MQSKRMRLGGFAVLAALLATGYNQSVVAQVVSQPTQTTATTNAINAANAATQAALAQVQQGTPPNFYPLVPTDVTGPGGSLGRAQGLRHLLLGPDRNTLPDSHGIIVARDPRYNFTGQWLPMQYGEARVASVPSVLTFGAVVAAPGTVFIDNTQARLDNITRGRDLDATASPLEPQYMPTGAASYVLNPGNEVQLLNGAMLIKSGSLHPVYVSTALNNQPFTVRLSKGSFAMVSVLDGRLTIANLSDVGQDSCIVTLGDTTRCDSGYTPIRVGHIAEIYPNGLCPENELVSTVVHTRVPLTDGFTFESMRLSYPRALKRFNITCSLNDCDLKRLMKTAAAVSYVDREREWNGLQPYAP